MKHFVLNGYQVDPTASGWLKVRRYAEVPEHDEHHPLVSIYLAIGGRLVIRGS
jgi:hypothetical protein